MPIAYSLRRVYKPLSFMNIHVYKSLDCERYYYKKRNDSTLKKLNTGSVSTIIQEAFLNKKQFQVISKIIYIKEKRFSLESRFSLLDVMDTGSRLMPQGGQSILIRLLKRVDLILLCYNYCPRSHSYTNFNVRHFPYIGSVFFLMSKFTN